MINGIHTLIYSKNADKLRKFFNEVLDLPSVDAGQGWLIFALPPGELAMHPAEEYSHEIYLMCEDIEETVKKLNAKGVKTTAVMDRGWGLVTTIKISKDDELGLYQPKHPTALKLKKKIKGK